MTTTTTTKKKTTTKKSSTDTQEIQELQSNPFQYEILDLVNKQRSNAGKVEVLKKYRNDALVSILIWNFDESIISLLPPGEVPYARVDEQSSLNDTLSGSIEKGNKVMGRADEFIRDRHTSIRNEWENFYNYLQGGNPSLSSLRRETMFIQMLEGLHPQEAEIMVLVKDKLLSNKYKLTQEIVGEAYPDIQWGGRS
jgi:hypothetical protein